MSWIDADWPDSEVAGYGKQKFGGLKSLVEKANRREAKPSVVYIAKEMKDEKSLEKFERSVFGDEKVALGARFFRCFRLEAKDIPDQASREKYEKLAPAVICFDEKGEEIATYTGTIDANGVLTRLDKSFNEVYEPKFQAHLAKFLDFLQRYERAEDKLANFKKRIEDVEKQLEKENGKCDGCTRALAEAKTREEEAKKEIAKLNEEKEKFLAPAKKSDPKTPVKN